MDDEVAQYSCPGDSDSASERRSVGEGGGKDGSSDTKNGTETTNPHSNVARSFDDITPQTVRTLSTESEHDRHRQAQSALRVKGQALRQFQRLVADALWRKCDISQILATPPTLPDGSSLWLSSSPPQPPSLVAAELLEGAIKQLLLAYRTFDAEYRQEEREVLNREERSEARRVAVKGKVEESKNDNEEAEQEEQRLLRLVGSDGAVTSMDSPARCGYDHGHHCAATGSWSLWRKQVQHDLERAERFDLMRDDR